MEARDVQKIYTGVPAQKDNSDPSQYKHIPVNDRRVDSARAQTINLLRVYPRIGQKRRQREVAQLVGIIGEDVTEVAAATAVLTDAENRDKSVRGIKGEVLKEVTHRLRTVRRLMTPWYADRLIPVVAATLVPDPNLKEAGLVMLDGIYSSSTKIDQAVPLYHETTKAFVKTRDELLRKELWDIIALRKSWYDYHSLAGTCTRLALFAKDPKVLNPYLVDLEVAYLAIPYMRERFRGEEEASKKDLDNLGRLLKMFAPKDASSTSALSLTISKQKDCDPGCRVCSGESAANLTRVARDEGLFTRPGFVTKLANFNLPKLEEATGTYRDRLAARDAYFGMLEMIGLPVDRQTVETDPLRIEARREFEVTRYLPEWRSYLSQQEKLGYKKVTGSPIPLTPDVVLDIAVKNPASHEEKSALVNEVRTAVVRGRGKRVGRELAIPLDRLMEAANVFSFHQFYDQEGRVIMSLRGLAPDETTAGRLGALIEFYRRGLITENDIIDADREFSKITEEIEKSARRPLTTRGYQSIVRDPSLRQLGYRSFTFSDDPESQDIRVKLRLAGEEFRYRLAADFKIVSGAGDINYFVSDYDRAWLEMVTISELAELLVFKEEEGERALVGGKRQKERLESQLKGHAAGLFDLPKGKTYTDEAFIELISSNIRLKDKNLGSINAGKNPQTDRMTTYRRESKVPSTHQDIPVKISLENGAMRLRRVIDPGRFSAEELARETQEILGELGIG